MNTVFVKGLPGQKMPMAGNPRTYITDAEAVAVEDSHYYRKAIADGDLVELSSEEWAAELAGRNQVDAGKAVVKKSAAS
jgi:hypothetical protein